MQAQTVSAWPFVCVIVITHNGRHHLERCLPSLYATEYPRFAVLLVDNASTDGASNYAEQHFPGLIALRNRENLGFARGNNEAIAQALRMNADYVVLLNDDTAILDRRWLKSAVEAAEADARIGMVGFALTADLAPVDPAAPIEVAPTDAIEGCALLMRSSLLRAIGCFDEVYFAYAEENDLEARALRAGFRFVSVSTPIFHLGAGTSSRYPLRQTYLVIRNVIRCSIKNRSMLRTLLRIVRVFDIGCNPFPLFFDRTDTTHRKIRGRGNLARNFAVFAAALGWNILHLPQTLRIKAQEEALIRQAHCAPQRSGG